MVIFYGRFHGRIFGGAREAPTETLPKIFFLRNPIPIEKCNQSDWESFFHLSLELIKYSTWELWMIITQIHKMRFKKNRTWQSFGISKMAQSSFWLFWDLSTPENIYLPVEIVEEWQEIKCQFDPAFSLTFVEGIGVHDTSGVIQSWTAHDRAMQVTVYMITNQWNI